MVVRMALGKRLKDALDQAGKDQAWLARQTGIDARTISITITRDSERSKYASQFARALGLNSDWLLAGVGPQWAPGDDAVPDSASARDRRSRGEVPLVSWVQAGRWNEIADPYETGGAERWVRCPAAHGSRTFALRVRGDSMYNPGGRVSFNDGDIIFVDPDRHADSGSLVIARLEQEMEATFKQLVRDGDRIYLKALNPSWPEDERYIKVTGRTTTCGVVISKAVEYD